MKKISHFALVLGIICIIATGLLATVNNFTSGQVLAQGQKELEDGLKEVMPQANKFEAIKDKEEIIYYKALDINNKLVGTVFKATAKGYSSNIETLVGMFLNGTINTIKVINQNETPGLGTRIQEVDETKGKQPWFQAQFNNKSVKDLDSSVQTITGATISSSAVINSVKIKAKQIQDLVKNAK